jgi:molecular chaperone GrpE (heat shock protein)
VTDTVSQLAGLAGQLDQLQDLFRRRLLDDRDKRQLIDALSAKVDRLEKARAAEAERPLVTRIALVIDRIEGRPPDESGFLPSIADELIDVLEAIGVTPIPVTEAFDSRKHEVVRVEGGSGDELRVTAVLRQGYEKSDVILRPAQVAVVRVERGDAPDPDGSH